MHLDLNLNTILELLILAVITGSFKLVWSINARLGVQNGRIGKLETRLDYHEEQDDKFHLESQQERRDLWQTINHKRGGSHA